MMFGFNNKAIGLPTLATNRPKFLRPFAVVSNSYMLYHCFLEALRDKLYVSELHYPDILEM